MIGSPAEGAIIRCIGLRKKAGEEYDWMLCYGTQMGQWTHQWSINCVAADSASRTYLETEQFEKGGELVTFELICSQKTIPPIVVKE